MNVAEVEPILAKARDGYGSILGKDDDDQDQLAPILKDSVSGAPQILLETDGRHSLENLLEIEKAGPMQLTNEKRKGKKRKPSGSKSERKRNELVVARNKRHQDNLEKARGLIFRHKGGVSFIPGPKPEGKSQRKKSKKRKR